jgi:hypothetical protein
MFFRIPDHGPSPKTNKTIELAWGGGGLKKPQNSSVRIIDVPAEIQTAQFPKISQLRYRMSQLAWCLIHNFCDAVN